MKFRKSEKVWNGDYPTLYLSLPSDNSHQKSNQIWRISNWRLHCRLHSAIEGIWRNKVLICCGGRVSTKHLNRWNFFLLSISCLRHAFSVKLTIMRRTFAHVRRTNEWHEKILKLTKYVQSSRCYCPASYVLNTGEKRCERTVVPRAQLCTYDVQKDCQTQIQWLARLGLRLPRHDTCFSGRGSSYIYGGVNAQQCTYDLQDIDA